jgi:hypothetical protein
MKVYPFWRLQERITFLAFSSFHRLLLMVSFFYLQSQ